MELLLKLVKKQEVLAANYSWFAKLTYNEQQKYLRDHPKSDLHKIPNLQKKPPRDPVQDAKKAADKIKSTGKKSLDYLRSKGGVIKQATTDKFEDVRNYRSADSADLKKARDNWEKVKQNPPPVNDEAPLYEWGGAAKKEAKTNKATKPHPMQTKEAAKAFEPNSAARRKVADKVSRLNKHFESYYSSMPKKQRLEAKVLMQNFAKNKPLGPKQVGKLAFYLDRYHRWANGLDEKKLGQGVLGAGAAAGLLTVAATPVGAAALSLGAILLAGYTVSKGVNFVKQAVKELDGGEKEDRAARFITRPHDDTSSLMDYFHSVEVASELPVDQVGHENDMLFKQVFSKLAAIMKTADLTPEQWMPLVKTSRR